MANLTNQQIKDTYPGLLNLNTATTGITTTPQQITDGLGNNTGARIATNFFTAPNLLAMNNPTQWIPDYGGPGFQSTAFTPLANQQNKITASIFYDSGQWSYSAITYSIISGTTTNDIIELAFYNTQYSPLTGIVPYQLIMSGITIPTPSNTGTFLSVALPSTLSFSGSGGGFYYMLMKISNAGVTPTVRFSQLANGFTNSIGFFTQAGGLVRNRANNQLVPGIGTNGATSIYIINTGTTFQTTYSLTDVDINTSVNGYSMGFGLKTSK